MSLTAHSSDWRALLRRPRYPGFVATVSLSRIVGFMFTTAGVLLVLHRTGSSALAGATVAAALIPAALAGPLLGAWLDLARRRRVLIVADQLLSCAGLTGLLLLAGHAPNWIVPAIAVAYGITRPFSTGSYASALPELVGPELLDRASAVEATSLNVAVIIGPAIVGVLAGAFGATTAVEVQLALTLVLAVLVAINPAFEARAPSAARSVGEVLRAGATALRRDRVLRDVTASSTLANFSWGLMTVGFPLLAVRELHTSRSAGGYLWAAVAIGSIAGTFLLAGAPSRRRSATSYLALGLSALLWPLGGSLPAGCALVVLTGVLEGPAYAGAIAMRQRRAPPETRALVLSTLTGLGGVAVALGGLVGGLLADPVACVIGFAAVNLVAALAIGRA